MLKSESLVNDVASIRNLGPKKRKLLCTVEGDRFVGLVLYCCYLDESHEARRLYLKKLFFRPTCSANCIQFQ